MRQLKRIALQPQLSRESAKKQFAGRYLTSNDYDLLVETDAVGILPDGDVAFVYLRNWARRDWLTDAYDCLRKLPFRKVNGSTRRPRALADSEGGDLLLGWRDDGYLTKSSREYGEIYGFLLAPLAATLSGVVREHLPNIWREQAERAKEGRSIVTYSADPKGAPSIFSTITVNHNPIFRSHVDGNNEKGMAVLMACGHFAGMALCLPRLRVAFPLQPGDVLIADTNREQHGNVGGLVGDRISVVFYLRKIDNYEEI